MAAIFAEWGGYKSGAAVAATPVNVALPQHKNLHVVVDPAGTVTVLYTLDPVEIIETGSPVWFAKTISAEGSVADEFLEGLYTGVRFEAVTDDCDYQIRWV